WAGGRILGVVAWAPRVVTAAAPPRALDAHRHAT
ncbi:hypothetical protein, partial [Streptomyces decoyicus]